MSASQRPSFLRRLMARATPTVDDDGGDMGTAIGMDYALDQPPLSALAGGPGGAEPGEGRKPQGAGWFGRARGGNSH